MTDRVIPLSAAWLDRAEVLRVQEAFAGRLSGDGPFGHRVEARLAAWLQTPAVLLTTSCTHALELALLAMGLRAGDEVICPSYTFVSTANAILRAGGRPVFADIEETTLGLDPADVERCLSPRTRVLLPVHYGGVAVEMKALAGLAKRRDLLILEDAAQGLGAAYEGRSLGTWGDAGAFSFHETKNVTCGEGGALALRDPELADRARIIREKGTNRQAFLRGEVDRYTWVHEGSSYVLSDILAAILDAQLDKWDEIARRRARVAAHYRDELTGWAAAHGIRLPPVLPGRVVNDHVFYLLYPSEVARDRCLEHLRSRGVQAAFHYVPLHSSPFGRGFASGAPLPVTERVAVTLLRLPIHPLLGDDDVRRVVEAVRDSPVP